MADPDNALAEALDTPALDTPAPAAEPSRMDVIRAAVDAQKERAANPDAPAGDKPAVERARAPDGKFAPGIDRPAPDRTAVPGKPAAAPQRAATVSGAEPRAAADPNAPVDPNAPAAVRPPPGWSPASKVAFDGLPESVKADIVKREAEVNAGFQKLAEYKSVDKYVEQAKRGGTTLDRALEQYTGIEALLRKDVFAGIDQVLANVGIKDPRSFITAYQQRFAGGNQHAPQPQQQTPSPQSLDPRQLAAQIRQELKSEQVLETAKTEVDRFFSDPKNRFAENVKPLMQKLALSGLANTVQDAYDMACRMDPEIAKLINQPTPADPRAVRIAAAANQARAAAKALTGAPARGAPPSDRAPEQGLPAREVARLAVAAQRARA